MIKYLLSALRDDTVLHPSDRAVLVFFMVVISLSLGGAVVAFVVAAVAVVPRWVFNLGTLFLALGLLLGYLAFHVLLAFWLSSKTKEDQETICQKIFAAEMGLVALWSGCLYFVVEDWGRWFLGTFFAFVFFHLPLLGVGSFLHRPVPQPVWYRGVRLLVLEVVQAVLDTRRSATDPGIQWGSLTLPTKSGTEHFLIIGATGSGKSVGEQLLMQSVFPKIRKGSGRRAVTYGPIAVLLPIILGCDPDVEVEVMNPFDMRSSRWAIGKDVTGPATAQQVAMDLCPEEEGTNRYFADSARAIIEAVVVAFIKIAPGKWEFRDLVLGLRTQKRIKNLLKRFSETRDVLEHFREERTAANVLSTLKSKISPFAPIAAAWHYAEDSVSIRDWIKGESILLLGTHESIRAPLDTINRLLFKRIVEEILDQNVREVRAKGKQTWVFLDEARDAGKLPGLHELLTQGRKVGACCVLVFQDVQGWHAVHTDLVGNEIAGQCGFGLFLHTESFDTAYWIAQRIGEYETKETVISKGPRGEETESEQFVKRFLVSPEELKQLPKASYENGLNAYMTTPYTDPLRIHIPGPVLFDQMLCPPDPNTSGFIRRPEEQEYLPDWDEEDYRRLGLDPKEMEDDESPKSIPEDMSVFFPKKK